MFLVNIPIAPHPEGTDRKERLDLISKAVDIAKEQIEAKGFKVKDRFLATLRIDCNNIEDLKSEFPDWIIENEDDWVFRTAD